MENVISNAMKGKGVLDLSGMGRRGVINGVTVERPLIDLEKVRSDEERSDELATQSQVAKITRTCTSVQVTTPP